MSIMEGEEVSFPKSLTLLSIGYNKPLDFAHIQSLSSPP